MAVSRVVSSAVGLVVLSAVALVDASAQTALSVDHYVRVVSSAPSMQGDLAQIYVRERVQAGTALRSTDLEGRVVIFVHGAGTPAEVSFDPPGASWMGYLADAGYDVFSMDM